MTEVEIQFVVRIPTTDPEEALAWVAEVVRVHLGPIERVGDAFLIAHDGARKDVETATTQAIFKEVYSEPHITPIPEPVTPAPESGPLQKEKRTRALIEAACYTAWYQDLNTWDIINIFNPIHLGFRERDEVQRHIEQHRATIERAAEAARATAQAVIEATLVSK